MKSYKLAAILLIISCDFVTFSREIVKNPSENPETPPSTSISNHPPAVKKNIPQNVENRLNMLSCIETVFNQAKPRCTQSKRIHSRTQVQDSFLEYNRNTNNRKNRRRGRRTFWFNPPWDARVATDVGAKFLQNSSTLGLYDT